MELSRVENRSIDRAFILRIAKNLHFDLDNESISSLIKKRKQPYVVGNKVLKPELVVKNYSISM